MNEAELDERVLLVAPTARDGATSHTLLDAAGVSHLLCNTIEDVCCEIGRGAGAAVITAEVVLGDKAKCLAGLLKAQPPWSDFPLIVLTPPGAELPGLLRALEHIGHMTLVKRPVQVSTLISTVRSALRDRQRQYVVRDLLNALHAERERYRITLSSIGDAVISTDADGRVTYLNGIAESITAWSRPDAIGKVLQEVFQIVNEHTRQPVENPATRALREGKVVGLANHTVLIGKDGTERPIDDSAAPMRDAAGVTVGAVLVFRDVSARKRAERALRESEARYRAIVEATPECVKLVSPDGTLLHMNPAGLAMIESDGEGAVVGQCIYDLIAPEHRAAFRSFNERVCRGEPGAFEFDIIGLRGTRRHMESTAVPLATTDGSFTHLAATRDVTERKSMEDALREADRKKDDFLALLAHELRNPLAPIRNGLQVMRLAGDQPDAISQARSMMDRQLSHMVRLVDDLLDVSRISRNKMELRCTRVSLTEVVSSAVETARPLIDAEGHELNVLLPQRPIFLNADLTRLAQVFSNLLTNSAKYTSHGGRIWLSAERRGSTVAVAVRDTGIGIPAASLASIFDMFSQVDRPIERATGGLGIGLALVKGLVEMHGGSVTARSPGKGQGSTFTVTLPVLTQPEPTPPSPSDSERVEAGPGRRVLVVDDNRDGADSLALVLRLLGDEVHAAHDGVEAVQQAEAFRPEIILMDVGMPRLNGLEATKRIREQPWGKTVKIIALTGWGQEGDKERSREAGCDGHLVKPVDLADLERLLGALQGN